MSLYLLGVEGSTRYSWGWGLHGGAFVWAKLRRASAWSILNTANGIAQAGLDISLRVKRRDILALELSYTLLYCFILWST